MAPVFGQPAVRAGTTAKENEQAYPVYTSGILLATFSFFVILLIVPPMFWHLRNRNLGATMLIAWVIVLNLQSIINSFLWPTDDMDRWYNGVGLCDVEVKLQIASSVALPAALCCILRALAEVMDTKRTTLVKTKAQKRRGYAIDILFCFGMPLLQMVLHYVCQSQRYYLYGISGCIPDVTPGWLSILLIYIPPTIWIFVDVYYAILILVRLYHYRQAFSSLLINSNIPKSRFMRLYILCLVGILALVPICAYVLYLNISAVSSDPHFVWREMHNPATWNNITLMPSGGHVVFDRYLWLGIAVIVFAFFGLGKEAVGMYRSGLLTVGFGCVFPSLKPDHVRQKSVTDTISSLGSRAKLLFKRKSAASSYTDSSTSRTLSFTDPLSPRNMSFLEAIDETEDHDEKRPWKAFLLRKSNQAKRHSTERPSATDPRPSLWSRVTFVFTSNVPESGSAADELMLNSLSGQNATISSQVPFEEHSPALPGLSPSKLPCEVIVRKEIRQGSETAETAPPVYHAS